MFRRHKETQSLLEASRKNLKAAENEIETLKRKYTKSNRLIQDIEIVLKEKGQGSVNTRYNKIEKLVDDYQSNN